MEGLTFVPAFPNSGLITQGPITLTNVTNPIIIIGNRLLLPIVQPLGER